MWVSELPVKRNTIVQVRRGGLWIKKIVVSLTALDAFYKFKSFLFQNKECEV